MRSDVTGFSTGLPGNRVQRKLEGDWSQQRTGSVALVQPGGDAEGSMRGAQGLRREGSSGEGLGGPASDSELLVRAGSRKLSGQKPDFSNLRRE